KTLFYTHLYIFSIFFPFRNGPIYAKAMQRKAVKRRSRKRVRPNKLAQPEE
ncbi:hypothetical protein S245_070864, partial [Arachis hypogaea]